MKLILTSNGFENKQIRDKFLMLLRVPVVKAKILFVPTAAIDDDARAVLPKCLAELKEAGVKTENIITYNCDKTITFEDVCVYDALYFPGGSATYLYEKIRTIGFDIIIKNMLDNGTVYVGASAGSMVACKPYMAFIKKSILVHCAKSNRGKTLPKLLPIKIKDYQALIKEDDKLYLFE